MAGGAALIALVKPQFEVGPDKVEKVRGGARRGRAGWRRSSGIARWW